MRISIVGTGYVGLITGLALTQAGHQVVCMDIDQEKVDLINSGRPPFHEPGIKQLLQQAITTGTLYASVLNETDIQDTDITIIAVGTPTKNDTIDLSFIKSAAQAIGKAIKTKKKYHIVAVKSTVTPGTTRTVVGTLVSRFSGKQVGEFGLCMNPEFLREGSAVHDALHPDRIVIGSVDRKSGNTYEKLFQTVTCPLIKTNLETAEFIKYTSNALLATLISFSNEIARICQTIEGVDCEDVWKALHLDHRLSPLVNGKRIAPGILSYLRAGCGYGGSCFPKDTQALAAFARSQQVISPLIDSVIQINATQPQEIVRLTTEALGPLRGKRIAVLGLSFKPDTDDTRESPGFSIAQLFQNEQATVMCHDPVVTAESLRKSYPEMDIIISQQLDQTLRGADAAVITTSWNEYRKITPAFIKKHMRTACVIDGRRILSPTVFEKQGVLYYGIGYSSLKQL